MPNQFFSPEGDIENYFVTDYWLIDQWIGDTLFGWGRNNSGQLGINASSGYDDRRTPITTLTGGTNWKQVSAGNAHVAAIKTDGTLWTWGLNGSGQLGDNTVTQRNTPVTTFAGGNNWRQVECGTEFTTAIKTDGTLWTWGSGGSGQIGNNDTLNRFTPVTTFAGGTTWKQVSAGYSFAAAVKSDGTLWTWGRNLTGSLGANDTTQRPTPVTTFAGGVNWLEVACGNAFTAAIKTDGTLWTWGDNGSRQLGVNSTQSTSLTPVTTFSGGTNWKQVAGANHTAAIKTDGTLWVWGNNSTAQLGINNTTFQSTPVTTFAGGTNWKQVSCGYHTAAIKTDGTLWVWGNNNFSGVTGGQLGDNTITNKSTPVTTFAGGSNWKQVVASSANTLAVTSGIPADLPLS